MKTSRNIFYLAAALLAVLLPSAVSCSPGLDEGSGAAPEITFKTNPVTLAGGTQFVSVKASAAWTITVAYNGDSQDWLNFTPSEGNGDNGRVILQYSANPGEKARKAVVTISSQSKKSTYTFAQAGSAEDVSPDPVVTPETPSTSTDTPSAWLELPRTDMGDNYAFFTHYMTAGGASKRNYSFYWSKSDMVSIWVAYPLNASLIGSGSRSDDSAFQKDPLLEAAGIRQPDVSYTFKGYTRGHQIPSADRYSGDSNRQTFYSSNMTPQLWDFNGGIWASLEGRVRTWARMAGTDTCYVVTGCVVDGKAKTLCNDAASTSVSVPKAYYKAMLRHTKAATVGIGGYNGIAIYLPHQDYGDGATTSKDMYISIDELESRIGIDLFVNLPAKVGEDMASRIEAEDPKSSTLWW